MQYKSFYSDDIVSICTNSKKCKTEWQKRRKYRITGSHPIFTYKQSDWKKKSFNYFWPKSFTNRFVRHGIAQEGNAKKKYMDVTGNIVEETGIIVSSSNPWMGYTPDGIIIENGKPTKLLEIKCPFIGKSKSIMECVQTLKFIDQGGSIQLKERHVQIQFGMALLDLEYFDFVIYSSFDHSMCIISVKYENEYCKNLLETLKKKLF